MRYIGGRQQACLTFLLELVWSMKASAGSQLFLLKPQLLAQQGLTARCSLGAEPRAQGRAGSALGRISPSLFTWETTAKEPRSCWQTAVPCPGGSWMLCVVPGLRMQLAGGFLC